MNELFVSKTTLEVTAFKLPATAQEAAARSYHSISAVLDHAGESLVAVHAAMERFGRAQIEAELGERAPKVLRAYDAFVEWLGDEWLSVESEL